MTSIQAHLNGGPRDDEFIVVDGYRFNVARLERLRPSSFTDNTEDPVPYKTGRYEARRDGNGDLVPHDLAGAVEFDFMGWDR